MVTLTQFTCSKLYYKPCLKLIENVGQWWRHAYNKGNTMYPTYIIILFISIHVYCMGTEQPIVLVVVCTISNTIGRILLTISYYVLYSNMAVFNCCLDLSK